MQFLFEAQDFNMRSFNLSATASIQDETNLGETGLLIASRMVDRFDLSAEQGEKHRLTLTKEKTYPGLAETDMPEIEAMPRFRLKAPEVRGKPNYLLALSARIMPTKFCRLFSAFRAKSRTWWCPGNTVQPWQATIPGSSEVGCCGASAGIP